MARDFVRGALRLALAGSLAVTVVALGPAPTARADWLGDARRLTHDAAAQARPDSSGPYVVHLDYRDARTVGAPDRPEQLADVRVLNVETGAGRNLTPQHTALGRPAISGDLVVWPDYGAGPGAGGIRLANLATGRTQRLATKGGAEVAIDGHRLCYERLNRIFVYNLRTRRETAVSPKAATAGACDISGNTVVWQDHRNGLDFDVYSYDLSSGRETRLTRDPADQSRPRVSGQVVVWQDQRNGASDTDIYSGDLATGVETRLSTAGGVQWFPDVDGSRVVWMDERHGHDSTEIYLYDLASRVETRVTNSSGWSGDPVVAGDRIVYVESLSGNRDLYASDVTEPVLTVEVERRIASGTAPLVTGRLVGADGNEVASESVLAEYSSDGRQWLPAGTAMTGHGGRFAVQAPTLTGPVRLRVRFAGSPEHPPTESRQVRLAVDPAPLRGVALR